MVVFSGGASGLLSLLLSDPRKQSVQREEHVTAIIAMNASNAMRHSQNIKPLISSSRRRGSCLFVSLNVFAYIHLEKLLLFLLSDVAPFLSCEPCIYLVNDLSSFCLFLSNEFVTHFQPVPIA